MSWHQIPAILATYGYGALFLVSVLEGPIVTVIAGFLASQGLLDPVLVFAVAVLGDLVGDVILYGLGLSGHTTLSLTRRPVRRDGRIDGLCRRLRAHPGKALLFGKLTHGAGFLFLLAAGAARVRPSTFLWYNLLGSLPKTAAFLVLGYVLGAAYARIGSYLGVASLAVFLLVCVGGLALFRRLSEPKRFEA